MARSHQPTNLEDVSDDLSGGACAVRDATAADATACAALYAPYVTDTTVSFEEEPPDAAEMARRIAAAQEQHAWLVGVVGDVVVGYAYAGSFRSRTAYRHTCEVSVYVDPDRRGGGVGRTLYTSLIDRMRASGMRLAVGGATMPNPASERLHRSLGFEVVGTFRDVGFKQGRWCDVRWFQKVLSD